MNRLPLIALLACFAAEAPRADTAVPPLVNYQDLLTDNGGAAIPDSTRRQEFNLYDAPLAGNRVWGPQVFDNVPNVNGRFNVILGTTDTVGRPISGAFATSQRYLGFKAGDAGADLSAIAELAPRQQILSAPYALSANTCGEVVFQKQNTDWASISFQSLGDGAHQSNMIFQTYDNNDEGFSFRTYTGGVSTERAGIDNSAVRVAGAVAVNGATVINDAGKLVGSPIGIDANDCEDRAETIWKRVTQGLSCSNGYLVVGVHAISHNGDA